MRSQRIVEKLGMDDVFRELLALQSLRDSLDFLGIGFESAFRRWNRWCSFEAIGPIVDFSSCDTMSALAVSVVAVINQYILLRSGRTWNSHFITGQTGLLIGSSCL